MRLFQAEMFLKYLLPIRTIVGGYYMALAHAQFLTLKWYFSVVYKLQSL